jgi:hypothetical protein
LTIPIRNQIEQVVSAIRTLETKLKPLAEYYTKEVRSFPAEEIVNFSQEYWLALSMRDSLTRVRNLIENNFIVIETLGVLALARYMFELVIQLKRIDKDPIFAIVYAREVIEQQVEHHNNMVKHLESEIKLYRQLAEREAAGNETALNIEARLGYKAEADKKIIDAIHATTLAVDEELATALTLYSEEAKVYGFAFQAHRLETQALPQLLTAVSKNKESLAEFDERWKEILSQSKYIANKWSKRAEQVGMTAQYEFIYSYTSRLLHATPGSISTNQQNLQDSEILLFFKYIYAEFLWVIRRAEGKNTDCVVH